MILQPRPNFIHNPEQIGPCRRLRYAVEARHESFKDPAFIAQLRRHDIALVFSDNPGRWPYIEELTADLIYIRLHGHQKLYTSNYDSVDLGSWAQPHPSLAKRGRSRRMDIL